MKMLQYYFVVILNNLQIDGVTEPRCWTHCLCLEWTTVLGHKAAMEG
jgi:hypothetical protein